MVRFAAWILALTALFAVPCLDAAEDVIIETNLTYAQRGDVKLQLDLARPREGNGPFPAIVFIHGGGWSGGNRQGYRGYLEQAAQRGYVALTISYRLTQPDQNKKPANPHPAQIHDCKAAVRWLREHAADYKVDPQRIGVTGGSAGGHLSLLVGLTEPKDGLEGETSRPELSTRVQAVVNVFGPTDLARLAETSAGTLDLLKWFCNGSVAEKPEVYRQASPLTFVTQDDPPILTLHGDKDTLVPPEQATLLDQKVKAMGGQHQLVMLEGQGHGFGGPAAKQADDAMWAFFAEHLRPGK